MRFQTIHLAGLALAASLAASSAPAAVINFDDQVGGTNLVNGTQITNQYAGLGVMAADQSLYGRVYAGGSCRGVVYSN